MLPLRLTELTTVYISTGPGVAEAVYPGIQLLLRAIWVIVLPLELTWERLPAVNRPAVTSAAKPPLKVTPPL